MITLLKYIPAFGVPDISPFCVKMEAYLRLAGVPYETKPADPRKLPKGKLPAIVHEGRIVADSSLIIDYLRDSLGVSLDDHLSARERATAQAIRSMFEEHLYFHMVHERWINEDAWRRYKPVLMKYAGEIGVPSFIAALIVPSLRRNIRKTLFAQGTGRYSEEERLAIGKKLLDSISELLGDGPFFFGARPTSIDATAYGFLVVLIRPEFDSALADHARKNPRFTAYLERVEAEMEAQAIAA